MNKKKAVALSATLLCCFLVVSVVLAQVSANYRLRWNALASSGGTVQSAHYAMDGTLGQSSPIGRSASSSYRMEAGYWYGAFSPPVPPRHLYLPLMLGR